MCDIMVVGIFAVGVKIMGYAFISYSSKDREKADELRNLLINENIDCRMAPYDVHAGSEWADRLTQALEECACVVLLLSDAAQKSPNVKREISLAATDSEYLKDRITKDSLGLQIKQNLKADPLSIRHGLSFKTRMLSFERPTTSQLPKRASSG